MRARSAGTLLVALAALAGLARLACVPPVGPRPAAEGWLVISNAIAGDLSVLAASAPATTARALPCFPLGRWAVRVGTAHGYLVTLDTERPAIVLTALEELRRVARGQAACAPGQDRVGRRVAIASRHVPYRGLVVGERLYVSYFGDNLVEVYDWVGAGEPTPPDLRLAGAIHFSAAENLGLSDLAFRDGSLLVAANGYACFARDCPGGRLHASHLFFVPPEPAAGTVFPEARPTNLNAAGLYTHRTGALYVIAAGDFAAGYASLQRLEPDRALRPEIRLPGNAAAKAAFALGDALFAVLQFSGEHVFLIDAARDRLLRIQRFDGATFVDVPPATGALPDRAQADLQDVLVDPADPGRAYVIDGKGERLVQVAVDTAGASLRVTAITSLGTSAYRRFPQWGLWLGAEEAQGAQKGA